MPLRAADLRFASIAVDGDHPCLSFAAEELRSHATEGHASDAMSVRIAAENGPIDGFRVTISGGDVRIAGHSPRGALNAVYWLLERLGWAWVEPGDGGAAFVPGHAIDDGDYVETPAFARRTLILGQDPLHDNWQAWMEWASRNRYNDLFFHDTPPSIFDRGGKTRPVTAAELDVDRKGWMFERWDTDGARIAEEAGRRGMTLQFGGHHLPSLVPREQFEHHPEWFPLRNGVRDARYNVCTASASLRAYLAERVELFLARFPGADVFHFWGDDIRGGGWCECGDGCGPTPSDQALFATNLIAETVARIAPVAQVAHLAYHDTLEPPTVARPRDNVALLFAPRERCYAHGIAADTCGRNRDQYWRPFTRLLDLFRREPGRVHVFEYYSDAILFKGLAPTHLDVLPADAEAYRAAGVSNMQNLMVGDRPWIGPPWHGWWTARCLWDERADAQSELARFCEAAYGEDAPALRRYYERAETAYRSTLDLHDFEPAGRRDVLDFSDTPRATLQRKAIELSEAADVLGDLFEELSGSPGRVEREAIQAEFVSAVAYHLALRTGAWALALDAVEGPARSGAEDAANALRAIEEWDATHNLPAYAVITGPMRRAMAYYVEEVRRVLGATR